jgi:hypothetical protein
MDRSHVSRLLSQGIAAAKAKQRRQAREYLMKVVELDEGNEQAWLWLSGVVDALEDQKVCLENVLAINPQNAHARAGLQWLEKLMAASAEPSPGSLTPCPCHFTIATLSGGFLKAPYVKGHEADAQIGHTFFFGMLAQPDPGRLFAALSLIGDLHSPASASAISSAAARACQRPVR